VRNSFKCINENRLHADNLSIRYVDQSCSEFMFSRREGVMKQ
ncbi:uncharacterized protein METZ01_LOCUS338430, partial [marine metagenome]